jgi:hypothetical protein
VVTFALAFKPSTTPLEVAANRLEVVLQQVPERQVLLGRQILRTLQQQPPRLLQNRLISLASQLLRFARTNLVDRLVQMTHDVKPIQNVDRLRGLLRHHLQVGTPHVAAHIPQTRRPLLAEPAEEAKQRLGLAMLAHP